MSSSSFQDETEYLLMSLILLFSPHSLPASEFGLVERFQLEYFTLLQKYLDKKYGELLLFVVMRSYTNFIDLYFRHMTDPDKSMAKFLSSVDIMVKCTEMQHMFLGIDNWT